MNPPQRPGLSKEELNEIRQRAERATPAPWFTRILSDEYVGTITAITTKPGRFDDPPAHFDSREVIAITYLSKPNYANVDDDKSDENATFIAHARVDVIRLVNEIQRLQKL